MAYFLSWLEAKVILDLNANNHNKHFEAFIFYIKALWPFEPVIIMEKHLFSETFKQSEFCSIDRFRRKNQTSLLTFLFVFI